MRSCILLRAKRLSV